MNEEQKKRLIWIKLYKKIGNAGMVCLKCGISRPTLRKWVKRYERDGLVGLLGESRAPNNSPNRKVFDQEEKFILLLRKERKLEVRRIQSELKRLHNITLSIRTIHKVLKKNEMPYLQKKRYYRKVAKR